MSQLIKPLWLPLAYNNSYFSASLGCLLFPLILHYFVKCPLFPLTPSFFFFLEINTLKRPLTLCLIVYTCLVTKTLLAKNNRCRGLSLSTAAALWQPSLLFHLWEKEAFFSFFFFFLPTPLWQLQVGKVECENYCQQNTSGGCSVQICKILKRQEERLYTFKVIYAQQTPDTGTPAELNTGRGYSCMKFESLFVSKEECCCLTDWLPLMPE